jgi:hypothetical protein
MVVLFDWLKLYLKKFVYPADAYSMRLTYDLGTRYIKVANPSIEQVLEAMELLNADASEPHRRGLILYIGNRLLSIHSIFKHPDRLLIHFNGVLPHRTNQTSLYKLVDTTQQINNSDNPHNCDDEDLVEAISSSGHIDEVCYHETVPRSEAIAVLKHFFLQGKVPDGLTWSRYF